MKTAHLASHCLQPAALLATAWIVATSAPASTLYWDTNGATVESGLTNPPDFGFTTRIWGSDANWTTDSTGAFSDGGIDAATSNPWVSTSADVAIFHGNDATGLLSVNVLGDVYANNILQVANGSAKASTFNDGGGGRIHLYSTSSADLLAAIDGKPNDANLTINVPVVLHQGAGNDAYIGVAGGNNAGVNLTGGITSENSVNLYFNSPGTYNISGGALDITGTIASTTADSNLVKALTISANIGSNVTTVTQSGAPNAAMVLSGANSYTGTSTANSGLLQFNSLAAIGGTGQSVSANLGGAIGFGPGVSAEDIATALSTRIAPTSTGGIAVNNHTAKNFDFNAAGLSNVSLGASYGGSNNATVTYTGTFTPYGTTYRLGGTGGRLVMSLANALTGSNDVTVTGIGTGNLTSRGNCVVALTNSNDYTGVTSVNSGTFNLGGAAGAITATSGIALNGGNFTLTNTSSAEGSVDRVNPAAINSNGGTITYTNTSGNTYAETLGTVTLASGQLNTVLSTNMAAGSQTLTLGGLTQTGPGTVTLSSAGSLNATTHMIQVSGASATPAEQIIGPWATVGTAAAAQTDYAKTDDSTNIVAAGIAASTEDTWTTAGNAYTASAGTTLTGTRTITALRYTGAVGTLALEANNLETFGILNGGSNTLTISSSGGILRQQGSAPASLYITTGNKAITISAPIEDNSGALTLVKSGTGGTLTLSGTNSYSGDTLVNAGILSLSQPNTSNEASTVTIAAAAVLNLGFSVDVTDTVAKLFIGATQMPAGIYGATGSGATTIDNTHFTGSGTLTVTSGPGGSGGGYATWATTNAGSEAANLDYDKDGVANGVEYFMGATGSTFTANPPLVAGKITWPYDASATGITYQVMVSEDLATWTPVSPQPVPSGATLPYTLPTSTPKRFVRLAVVTSP
jgi:autotransporter-associated beta strand protein